MHELYSGNNGLARIDQGSILVEPKIGLPAKKGVLKSDVTVMPFWLGRRSWDNNDLGRFHHELRNDIRFIDYIAFDLPDVAEATGEPYPALAQVDVDLRRELARTSGPLAVFLIATPTVADYPWVTNIPKGIQQARTQYDRKSTFIYKVILNDPIVPVPEEAHEDPNHHFSKNEINAHGLDGVYLPYNHDYPSTSIRRLVEFMSRVMGYDLPSPEFPDYPTGIIKKIAWHVNRENFNLFEPREGAIPKYPIVNGGPEFPF